MIIAGIIGQWLASLLLGTGIAIEIIAQADLGFLAITIGSAIFGIANKIKLLGYENQEWRRFRRGRR